jgi:hypothetical protein
MARSISSSNSQRASSASRICHGLPNWRWGLASGVWGLEISQREPKVRKVRNGRAATKEYRADGESNDDVRSRTTHGSPRRHSTSDSGVWPVAISWINGRITTRRI